MIKYLKLPFYFDAKQMQQEVIGFAAQAWKLHYQSLHYEGEWKALPLRSVNGKMDDIIISPYANSEYKDTAFLKDCGYLKQVLSTFECELKAVRLLKLNAGAVIKEHRDNELYFEKGEVRLHVPVVTNELVEFYLNKERITLKEGECWYMNFNLPHHIINNSKIDRIHLVIDAVVNDWVKKLFARKDNPVKEEMEENNDYDEKTKREMIARFREMNTEVAHKLADKLELTLTP